MKNKWLRRLLLCLVCSVCTLLAVLQAAVDWYSVQGWTMRPYMDVFMGRLWRTNWYSGEMLMLAMIVGACTREKHRWVVLGFGLPYVAVDVWMLMEGGGDTGSGWEWASKLYLLPLAGQVMMFSMAGRVGIILIRGRQKDRSGEVLRRDPSAVL